MLYVVFVSSIFKKSSLDELNGISRCRVVGEFGNFLIVDTKATDLGGKAHESTLIYGAFPLLLEGKIDGKKYRESMIKLIRKAKVSKKQTIKLECVNLNSRTEYSAKDLEVWLGLEMEKLGYTPELKSPDMLVYLVLLDMNCYVGMMEFSKLRLGFINPLRHYHREKLVSRSELKLEQAFDYFGIGGKGIAIDLGAAPGGWSCYLARNGYRTIAIDNGELNKKAIMQSGVRVKEAAGVVSEESFSNAGIVHLAGKSEESAKRVRLQADLLVDDMNIDCSSTYAAIRPYLGKIKDGGRAVVTIKCITKNIPKYISQAKSLFSKEFRILGIKVLPSNRQEFTLVMEKVV